MRRAPFKLWLPTALLCFAVLAPSVFSQIALSLSLDRKSYLNYENIWASVTIKNQSGRPLTFGDNPQISGTLTFDVLDEKGNLVSLRKNRPAPVYGVIPPGAEDRMTLSLSRLYALNYQGRYLVRAYLKHARLPDLYRSNEVAFAINEGQEVWKTRVGLPALDTATDSSMVPSRLYRVLRAFDGEDSVYYLRIEDQKVIYGVTRLGMDIGPDGGPEIEVDRLSKLHLLVQNSPRLFTYFIYNPNCLLDKRHILATDEHGSSPRLARDPKDGSVLLAGGRQAIKGVDYEEVNGVPVSPKK